MNRIAAVVAGLSLAFVGSSATFATTINVPSDQPTIQGAINASRNGDVINIAAGTYNEHSLDPGGKAITIQGTVNGDGTLATTIDAQQGGRVFVFNSNETVTVIQNLIMTGGRSSYGAGISCENSNPIIASCTITGNTASYYGGGIACDNNSSPTITSCTITGNSATDYGAGGGIACDNNSSPTITSCTITGNTATDGGGIYCEGGSPTISGCSISNNTANDNGGGGICCDVNSSPTISACTISENTPDNIVGASAASLRGETGPSVITLENSTICGTGEHIKGVLIEHRGENHISDCIDDGDVNGDGVVDANDLDSLHASLGICPHDIDHDGETDVEDLLLFLAGYGTTCP